MLPRRLAQDICSLSPGADRLAHTVEMNVTEDGEVEDFGIYRSVIESDAHLTYTHSDSILENSDSISQWYRENNIQHEDAQDFRGLAESLDSLDTVTENMREDRWDESLILNDRQSPSSRIIEEMMITANETVGEYLSDEGIGGYRVEEAPERGWTEEVATELSQLGYQPPAELHDNPARSLNNFFAEVVDEEDEKQARKAVVTKLPRARYEARGITPAGHFGLGTQDYAHFTSPIRRAVDLVNHRIVADTFEGGREEVSDIAEHVSDQQEAADDLLGGVGELEPPPLVPTADHPPDAPNPHSKSVTIRPGSLRRGSPHSTAVRNSRQYGTFVIPTEPRSNDPIPSHTSRSPQYARICIRVHRRAEPVLFLLADSPP